MSTVYCVVPIYNRLDMTKRFMTCIDHQDYPNIHLVLVNDGSTDGTKEFLNKIVRPNVKILVGDGSLWWSGAMWLGINFVIGKAKHSDFLLMINNDVYFEPQYVSTLIKESVNRGSAVVGSSQRDEISGNLINNGWVVNYFDMTITPVKEKAQVRPVDALSGRGVLIPMSAVFLVGNIRRRVFPHYLADIDYTTRLSESGWDLIVSKSADIFTAAGNSGKSASSGFASTFLSSRSSRNLLHRFIFFSIHGPLFFRITALPRFVFLMLLKVLRFA